MTNKEVINFLNQVRKILLDDKSWLESTIQPINEAFDMAINALTAQPETHDKRTKMHARDLISRKTAIDALDKEYRCTDRSDDWDGLKTAILIIENLPSAQPDISEYSDKLWRNAYERGKRDAQPERPKGKWILVKEYVKIAAYKCSECGRNVWDDTGYSVMKDYPFCHCGAEMIGVENGQ